MLIIKKIEKNSRNTLLPSFFHFYTIFVGDTNELKKYWKIYCKKKKRKKFNPKRLSNRTQNYR